MSSTMLDQAVIDAEALREAAMKNAEQEVLEKYSGEIKEAVSSLLEQEEDMFGMEDEEGLDAEPGIADQMPIAATDGENMCPCPEEEEPMVLDLDQIVAAAQAAESEEEMDLGGEVAADEEELFEVNDDNLLEVISAVLSEEEKDEDEEQTPEERAKDIKGKGESVASELKDTPPEDKAKVLAALRKKKNEGAEKIAPEIFEDSREQEIDENEELDEELLDEIVEALVVDLKNVPTGENFHTHPTMGQNERGLDIALAQEQDTEFAEEQKELRQALKKLQEQNKSQTLKMNKQKKEYKQLKSITLKATKKLEEVNFSNAKLIYTNRILKSDSLNERQKTKLVEAISKVGSVEEAKIVFNTLNENLSSKGRSAPKTLNEAASRNSQLILKSNTEKQPANKNQVDRLRRLAGII